MEWRQRWHWGKWGPGRGQTAQSGLAGVPSSSVKGVGGRCLISWASRVVWIQGLSSPSTKEYSVGGWWTASAIQKVYHRWICAQPLPIQIYDVLRYVLIRKLTVTNLHLYTDARLRPHNCLSCGLPATYSHHQLEKKSRPPCNHWGKLICTLSPAPAPGMQPSALAMPGQRPALSDAHGLLCIL